MEDPMVVFVNRTPTHNTKARNYWWGDLQMCSFNSICLQLSRTLTRSMGDEEKKLVLDDSNASEPPSTTLQASESTVDDRSFSVIECGVVEGGNVERHVL
jgi:hypothetical protein